MKDLPHRVRHLMPGLVGVVLFIGCGVNPGSAPTAQELIQAQNESLSSFKERAKVEEKTYPLGKAFVVDMSGMTVTDEDLDYLRGIGSVAELDLSGATITDEQFTRIASGDCKLTTLFKLDVSDTPISDAGLKEAHGLPILANVNVKGSKVTDAGVKAFQQVRAKKKMPYGLKFKIEH